MLRVGIIGYGKMGILHGALINGSKKAKVTAICDRSWVMRFGIKKVYPSVHTYSDVGIMLEREKLDVVIISTPTFNHVQSALLCIEKGCDLFIEKPLASSFDDAKTLLHLAKEKGVKIQVGFCNRYAPSIAKGKDLLEQNVVGKAVSAKAFMYIADVFEPHSGWRYSKAASGGGALMDFGIHMLDQLCWFFGELESVHAEARQLYSLEVEDEVSCKMVFWNGVPVDFETSWSKEEYRKTYARLEIQCQEGRMIVTDQTLEVYDLDGKLLEEFVYPDLYMGTFMDVGGLLYSKQMEAFLDMLEGKKTTNLQEAVYVQNVVNHIYKSVAEDKKIRVESVC